jgi:tRNA isopentenyl-2-thiomethyl-A-37 hydroxylase MiaE
MVYNGINFYVSSLASVKKHFEERYRQLDQLIDDAYISKSIYDKDPESAEVSGTEDMVYIFKAIVIAMYSLEKRMKTKVERLNQRVFANYCVDLVQATFLYITNKKKLLRASSDDSQKESDFIDLSVDLFNQIEARNFERYFWKTLTQEDGKHSEIMLNTIARHYSGKSKYTHSSKDLFLYSYRIEDFENHSSDMTAGFAGSREPCNNAFKLFVNAIESRNEIERNLFLLSSVIIISSIAYSMSFNNPFGIGQLLYNVLYSAFAFIAAQKIEEINSEKSEKYKAFIGSIRSVSHSLKSGRFLQNSEDKSPVTVFKPKWLYSVDLSNNAESIKASPTLQDIHFIAALTFVKLGAKQLSQASINKMDMATCYMNINIALAKTYEQIAQPNFRFSESHASSISSALAILILDNIRGSQNHNFDPAAILRPITGVLLNVPSVSDMYQTIDKTIGLHDLQREQQHDSGQHGQENRHVMFIREMLKEKVLNSTSKFSPSKNQMKHRRAVTPIITDNTGSDTSPDSENRNVWSRFLGGHSYAY